MQLSWGEIRYREPLIASCIYILIFWVSSRTVGYKYLHIADIVT
jgi:hypothetical protein